MAATLSSSSKSSWKVPEEYGSFKLTAGPVSLLESYNQPINVAKWTSQKTGLRVVLIDVEGPLCNLFGSVATEVFDDSGCPHTLEHLVFLGSEQYPYKGVLDSLANRAFAAGTNAWTDTTNTTYTITTAGEEGFLRILPVYLDHVLYPTLTDEGFTTEVYHLNGKGEDAGVVYSEMQGRETLPFSVMALKQQRSLYPEGSAYRSETGGLLEALRVLDIDQIRKYHKSYYLPHNLCLFATGKIDPEKMLKVLVEEVEPTIEKHNQARGPKPEGWKRPFMETPSVNPPKLEGDKVEVAEFPEKDESMGEVSLTWVGPPQNDFLAGQAIDVLNAYLSDSAISPLQKELVEVDDPLATDISFDTTDQSTMIINLNLQSVPSKKLDQASEDVKKVLRSVVENGIDMERMQMVLRRERRRILNALETEASDSLTTSLLSDFLFGPENGEDIPRSLNDIKRFNELLSWDAEKWAGLLKQYYLDQASLTVVGKPSSQLADKLEKETAERLERNLKMYGEDGLKKLEDKLKHAQEVNDRDIPPEVLSSFKIPDVEGIRWIDVKSAAAGINRASFDNDVQQHVSKDNTKLPHFLQFEHVNSNFVEISIYLDAANLKANSDLLNLYIGSFHSLPIVREDGTRLPFDEVVKQLDTETVAYYTTFGSGLTEQLEAHIKVEKDKYESAIRWLRDLLYGSVFDVERLRIMARKQVSNLPMEKREGGVVGSGTFRDMVLDPSKSSAAALSIISRNKTAPIVAERLKEDPDSVVKELEQLRKAITSPENMRIAVAGDILAMDKPLAPWEAHFKAPWSNSLHRPTLGRDVLSELGKAPSKQARVVPLPSIESSFGYHGCKGIDSFTHPDLPALMVAYTVMNALEGLLWKAVRGAGLAYGASISADVERGLVLFRVWRSPDAALAWVKAGEAVRKMLKGEYLPLDALTIEAAKSELVYSVAGQASTVSDAAETSWENQVLKGLPQTYQRDLLQKAGKVTREQVAAAIEKYLLPVFDANTSIAAVATSQTKSKDIEKQLEAAGYEVTEVHIVNEADEEDGSESGSESGSEDTQSEQSMGEVWADVSART